MARRAVPLLLFAWLWPTYGYFYQGSQHNEAARFDQLRAIVEDHALGIEKYAWMNTADGVDYGEPPDRHTYPNKAPGTVFVALVPFSFWWAVLKILPLAPGLYWHLVAYATTVLTSGLLSSLAAVAFYGALVRLGLSVRVAVLGTIGVWLGSIQFPYGTLFFSHATTSALLVLAFSVLLRLRRGGLSSMRHPALRLAGAGLAMGVAVSGEYPSVLLVAPLGLYALWGLWRDPGDGALRWRALFAIGIGTALGLAVWIGYNLLVFERPFFTGYSVYAQTGLLFPIYQKGLLGMSWPGWELARSALFEILLGPQIGLLYIAIKNGGVYACNPIFWLALPGWVLLWRRGYRAEALLVLAMTLAYLTFNVCYGESIVDWGGGGSLGPRHLAPLLPFLGLAMAFAIARLWPVYLPLLAVSVFYMLIATAVEPRISYSFRDTYQQFYLPAFLEGILAQNSSDLFGAPPARHFDGSNAFNLGSLLGLPRAFSLAPLLLWWWAMAALLLRRTSFALAPPAAGARARVRPRLALLALVGMSLALALTLLGPAFHRSWTSSRLGLAGRYFQGGSWAGEPSMVKIDPTIDADWSEASPLAPPFSVEWKGWLLAPREGDYDFTLESDDGSSLSLDGVLIVDNGGEHSMRRRTARRRLSAGPHVVELRYVNLMFGGAVRLLWLPPGALHETVVPAAALRPL